MDGLTFKEEGKQKKNLNMKLIFIIVKRYISNKGKFLEGWGVRNEKLKSNMINQSGLVS